MSSGLSRSTRKVQEALAALGADCHVVELPSSTRTAVEAAAAIGCSVEQIAKSILFRTVQDRRPILVIASGVNRVNEGSLEAILGEQIEKADAVYVREKTGFVIGGVPPVGHAEAIQIMIDEDLMKMDELWAAAGSPHSVFKLSVKSLLEITGGTVVAVKQGPRADEGVED